MVIVNWNGESFLDRCLSALLAQTVAPHEIILLDNASTDGSLDIVRGFPSVRILPQKNNIGFASGNNLAIAAASPDAKWFVFLNPDAFPSNRWLEELLLAAHDHPGFEVFASKLASAANPDILDGKGDIYHISGVAWRDGHGHAADDSETEVKAIFSPCAAAALFRRDVFHEANGFDEDFFCYMEDVDLGFRLRLLGYRCLYVPKSVVYHIGSATTGRRSAFSIYHGHRNLVWTYIKNMPGVLFWLLLPVHLTLNCVMCIYFALMGQGRTIFRAKWDALKGLPKMWRKRRQIQVNRRVSEMSIWRMLDKRIVLRPSTTNSWFHKGVK